MTELDLLDALAEGVTGFEREEYPDLETIDRLLREFAEKGYITRLVRAVYLVPGQSQSLMRVDVPHGLTPIGEYRHKQLSRCARQSAGSV